MAEHIVTDPQGTRHIINAPDGATPEEVMAYAQKTIPEQAAAAQPSLMERVGSDVSERVGNMQEIAARDAARGTNPVSAGLKQAGQGAGVIADTAGEIAGSAYKTLTPQPVQDLVGATGHALAQSSLGQFAGKAVKAGVGKFNEAVPEGTETRDYLNAGANLAQLIPGAKGAEVVAKVAPDAARAAVDVAKAAGETVVEGAGNAVKAGVEKVSDAVSNPVTSDMVRGEAGKAYKAASDLGGVLSPQSRNSFLDNVAKLHPDNPEVPSDPKYKAIIQHLESNRNKPLTLDGAQAIDKYLGAQINNSVLPNGKLDEVGHKIANIQDALREHTFNPDPSAFIGGNKGFEAWQEGNRLWQKQAQLGDIERIIQKADGSENEATVLKNGFKNLSNNPKRMRGYDDETRALIKQAATTGNVTDLLKTWGSRLVPIVAAGAHGPLAGVVAQGASMASRRGATALQVGRANKVAKQISKDYKFAGETAPEAGPTLLLENKRPETVAARYADQLDRGQNSGPVIKAGAPAEAPAPLALPAPGKEYIGDGKGGMRAMLPEELQAAQAQRADYASRGLTPDVLRTINRNNIREKFGPAFDALQQADKEAVAKQIDEMWQANPKASIPDLIDQAAVKSQELAAAKGEEGSMTALGQALLQAQKSGQKINPADAMKYLKSRGSK